MTNLFPKSFSGERSGIAGVRLGRNPTQADLISALRVPVIVKPNMEGSSIGIDQGSICTTMEEAKDLALRKLSNFPEE